MQMAAAAFIERQVLAPRDARAGRGLRFGEPGHPAARAGAKVTGLDIAPNLLEPARQRALDESLNVEFEEGDAEQFPYGDARSTWSCRCSARCSRRGLRAAADCCASAVRAVASRWLTGHRRASSVRCSKQPLPMCRRRHPFTAPVGRRSCRPRAIGKRRRRFTSHTPYGFLPPADDAGADG